MLKAAISFPDFDEKLTFDGLQILDEKLLSSNNSSYLESKKVNSKDFIMKRLKHKLAKI